MDELPKDNVFDIFSRLRIKDLSCLSCVCKDFCKYNNDPVLENIRRKDQPIPLLLQQFLASDSAVCCNLSFLHTLEEDGASDSVHVKVKKGQVLDFRRNDSSAFERVSKLVLGSCNGLILAKLSEDSECGISLTVINPLSKLRYELPPIQISSGVQPLHLWSGGIGFDYSTNTFKVVCVVSEKAEDSPNIDVVNEKPCTLVYDLRLGSWKEISQIKSYPITGEGVFANGCLHWLVDYYSCMLPIDEKKKVVCFDVKEEEFLLIDPPKRKDGGWINQYMVDLNGEVAYVCNDVGVSVDVWILKEKEWVMRCLLVFSDKTPNCNGPVRVTGCWNKEGAMLYTGEQGKHMYVYDPKNHDLKEVVLEDGCEANIRMYRNSSLAINAFNSNAYAIKC